MPSTSLTTVAVFGASGQLGVRICSRLRARGVRVVPVSRSLGTDLLTGEGMLDVLYGVDTAVDASRPVPRDGRSVLETLTTASLNFVHACELSGVKRVVFVSIVGVDDDDVAEVDYYAAKRAQERILEQAPMPSTIVRSTQWYEFATSPAAVDLRPDEVRVQDWLIQPTAADSVAHVISELAFAPGAPSLVSVAGPEVMHLPVLTERTLRHRHDLRRVQVLRPSVAALGTGGLLPPRDAIIVGPDLGSWLAGAASEQGQ